MHVVAADGQLEKVVERGRRTVSVPVPGRGVGTACVRPVPSRPGEGWHDHQPGIRGAAGGQRQRAGLEGGAEGGAGSVKGVFVQDLVG